MYLSVNILKLENIFELEICKFIYLQYDNLLTEVFADYFTLVSKFQSYYTRNASKINFTFLECTLLKDSYHVYIWALNSGITFPKVFKLYHTRVL